MPERVLFDLNVLLDVLQERIPHVADSGPAMERVADGRMEGVLSAASVDTLAYLLSTHQSAARTQGIIRFLRLKFRIAPVTESIIDAALASDWADLEDAILYQTAVSAGCDVLLTRNVADFRKAPITGPRILTPAEYRLVDS